jgi:putative FmdB family regulatory protein
MPCYDLECSACGHRFEAFQAREARPPYRCKSCGRKKARRILVKAPAVHAKYAEGHTRKNRGRG